MNGITTEDVRGIVHQENHRVEIAMTKLTESIEKMVRAVNDLTVQNHVTEERFRQVYERIEVNEGVVTTTTKILSKLEATVAVNSFGFNTLWKIALALFVPLVGIITVIFKWFSSIQLGQTKLIADAILEIGKVAGN